MKLVIESLPENEAALPGWLDRHLVGADLAALIAELHAIHPIPAKSPPSLDELLANRRDALLARGTSALPRSTMRTLLTCPSLLLELQETVLIEGGDYWEQLTRQAFPTPSATIPSSHAEKQLPPKRSRRWVLGFATVAAVLVAVWGLGGFSSDWGWNRPSIQRGNVDASKYMNRLADAGEEWFNELPTTAPELMQRIEDIKRGCLQLTFAEHRPLALADREWLVERCRAWAGKIEQQRILLRDDGEVVAVQKEMDAVMRQAVDAMRKRAAILVATLECRSNNIPI